MAGTGAGALGGAAACGVFGRMNLSGGFRGKRMVRASSLLGDDP